MSAPKFFRLPAGVDPRTDTDRLMHQDMAAIARFLARVHNPERRQQMAVHRAKWRISN